MITITKAKVNFKPLQKFIKDLDRQIVEKSTPRALNRAMVTVKKEASIEARKRINLPANGSSKGGAGLTRPGVNNLLRTDTATANKLSVSLWAQSKAISHIHFVVGSKEPEDQLGKKFGRRRKLSIMVTPGQKIRLPHSFIAKANGATQVFVRQGKKSLPLIKRAVKGLFGFLDNKEVRDRLAEVGHQRFEETMKQEVNYFLTTKAGKLNE